MSDTSQPSAPPPSAPAPSAPPPQQTETPVNESPVNQQAPIGDQAPPKPPGQDSNKSSHIGRREALQNAFAKAEQARVAAAARTKPPAMGHNQPPEAMAKEKPAAPEKTKRAEKAERTSQPSLQQQRYREGGKFAKDPAKAAAQVPGGRQELPGQQELPLGDTPAAQPGDKPAQIKPLDETAKYREPPGRFSEQAKTEWHGAPESVRGAVYTMAKEFQGAYEKYRGDHEVMEELRPFHDLATKQGTSLRKAFDNYYGMEQKLRQDIVGGLDIIVQNMRMKHPDGSPITLSDVAHYITTLTPEQRQATQQQNHLSAADQRIGQLHQQVEQQSQILNQMLYQQHFMKTQAEVDNFARSHPRLDELSDVIKSELDLGFTLEQAYARADRLRPARPQAAQTRNTPAQTRKTSISGAPDGAGGKPVNTRPSDGQRRNGARHPTRREALAKAMRSVGNGV